MKGTKMKNWIRGLVFIPIIMGTPSMVHAELEEILSKFKAYITIQEEYDSNINLNGQNTFSATNKKADFITLISPGFRFSTQPKSPVTGEFLKTPTAENRYGMDLDFNGGFNFYARSHENNYISLNGALNGWYALSQRLTFQARDYLIRSNDIYEPDYSSTAIQGQNLPSRTNKRIPWFRNVFEPSLQYQFGTEDFFTVKYQNNVYNVQSGLYENSIGNTINSNINYWFDIRNGVSFGYALAFANFQQSADVLNPSPDLMQNTATGRYTYRFNPNTSVFVDYNQSWINYEKPGIDYVVYIPSIGVTHTFTPTLTGSAQLGYYWAIPGRGSTVSAPSYKLFLTQKGEKTTYTISIEGGYTQDILDAQNRGFTKYNKAIGRITYQLLERMNVGLYSSYEFDKNPTPAIGGQGETDKIWAIGGNASYQILRWLTFALDVSYRQDHSNIPINDFTDYRGIFRITATY